MTGDILAYLALFIAGIMALFTTSRLCLSVFIFLAVWYIADEILVYYDSYYTYPALLNGILIDFCFLKWLSAKRINCIIIPIVTAFSAFYAFVCLLTYYFDIVLLLDQYGLVMGITALLASLEGAKHGFNSSRRVYTYVRWWVVRLPLHTIGIHIDKEGL